MEHPQSLRALLEIIRLRPFMLLGNKSLETLDAFMSGYESALYILGKNEEYFFNSGHFSYWLVFEHKFDSSCYIMGWAKYLTKISANVEEAFERFFKLYDEYLLLIPTTYKSTDNANSIELNTKFAKLNPFFVDKELPSKIDIIRLYPKRWCFIKYQFSNSIEICSTLTAL